MAKSKKKTRKAPAAPSEGRRVPTAPGPPLATPTAQAQRQELPGEKLWAPALQVLDAVPPLFGRALNAVFRFFMGGSQVERAVGGLQPIVDQVNKRGLEVRRLSDAALAAKTDEFRTRLAGGETLDDLLPEAFAAVREASSRTIGLRHFDVQIIGGIVLHQGRIAEMVTGEGKTLVATLPAYLNALTGQAVHIITVNDYLAQRDREWMGPVYEALGLSCGVIQSDMDPMERYRAYRGNITFGTMSEFGFDYLRKNLESRAEYQIQGSLDYAIVDEVDSVLIDEARVPLIISGATGVDSGKTYTVVKRIVDELRSGVDYTVNEKDKTVTLTEEGLTAIEEAAHRGIYESENIEWPHYVEQAIRARDLYKENRDYVIQDGEVIIVDQFTGRLQHGRRWSDWLHEAIEAKHGMPVGQEQRTVATITYQNFFRLYKKLAGMTGTALTQAEEFSKIYKLEVVPIPTHMPLRRASFPDLVYRTEGEKIDAVVEEVKRYNAAARPVLVGTTSVEKSAKLSERLKREGVQHEVLNAKNHAREAEIIAKAGQQGGVTISTNMAGRGTDIVLGEGVVRCRGLAPDDPRVPANCLRFRGGRPGDRDVCCGLHVIGTERHEARRIDDQLRGRAGRQGDPGSSRFFLSLEDDLMRLFMGNWTRSFLQNSALPPGQPIESGMVTRAIGRAQRKVEERNFEMRKQITEYDELMDQRRKGIYGDRQKLVEGGSEQSIEQLVDALLASYIDPKWAAAEGQRYVAERNYRPLAAALAAFGVEISQQEWQEANREELDDLIRVRAKSSSRDVAARAAEAVGPWVEACILHWAPQDAFPSEWNIAGLVRFLSTVGVNRAEAELRGAVLTPVVHEITRAVQATADSSTADALVRGWVDRAVEMDAAWIAGTPEWDIHALQAYCEALGLSFYASELSGRVQSRDRLAEFLTEKITQAYGTSPTGSLIERLVAVAVWPYLGSAAFRRRPSYEHLAFHVESRLAVQVEAETLRRAAQAAREELVEQALGAKPAQWGDGHDVEELLGAAFSEFLSEDLSAPDRNLAGLVEDHPDLSRIEGSDAFGLTKPTYEALRTLLIGVFGRLAQNSDNPVGVEPHLLDALENAVDITVERLVSERMMGTLADECYADLTAWARKLGLTITRERWQQLDEEELVHHFAAQALQAWQDQPLEQAIERSFTIAFEMEIDAPGYAQRATYTGLAAWGARWTGGPQEGGGHLEADVSRLDQERRRALDTKMRLRRRSLLERTRDDEKDLAQQVETLRKQWSDSLVSQLKERLHEASDDVNEQVDFLTGIALNAFEQSVDAKEELPFDHLSNWLKEHFRARVSVADLQEAMYGGQSSVKEFLAGKLAGQYARRDAEPLAEATVVGAMALYANARECAFGWKLDQLGRWADRARLAFSAEDAEQEVRETVKQYFLSATLERHKQASRRSVVFDVIRSGLGSFLSVSLSTDGRNVNELAGHVGREYQFYGIAAALDHHQRFVAEATAGEGERAPEQEAAGEAAPARAADGDAAAPRGASQPLDAQRLLSLAPPAPLYRLQPIDLCKHSGETVREMLLKEARRLFTQARRVLPASAGELGGESLLSRGRALLIHTIDERWIEYVHAMSALLEGIGLRGYSGVDPKVAYKKEGSEMFLQMVTEAKENFARQIGLTVRRALEGQTSRVAEAYKAIQVRQAQASSVYQQAAAQAAAAARAPRPGELPAQPGQQRIGPIRAGKQPGRNDPCPCGATDKNGRPIKYKKCHGRFT